LACESLRWTLAQNSSKLCLVTELYRSNKQQQVIKQSIGTWSLA
jgi:hypothetical protein